MQRVSAAELGAVSGRTDSDPQLTFNSRVISSTNSSVELTKCYLTTRSAVRDLVGQF